LAEDVIVEGQSYRKRNPVGVWVLAGLLGVFTLLIYPLVWYYRINDEARRYLHDDSIRPGVSVLAIVPGFLLIVPPFVSIYHTGQRIQRMEERAGVVKTIEPVLGLVLAFLYSLYIWYYQSHLNGLWDRAAGRGGQLPPAPGPPAIPPPPPGQPGG